jgi:hypothetical protein
VGLIAGCPSGDRSSQETAGEQAAGGPAGGVLPLAAIQADATPYIGKPVSGTATVAEVVSDRSFWAEADASQVMVVVDESVASPPKLTMGQSVTVQGTVNDVKQAEQVAAVKSLSDEARQMLQGQPAYILATEVTAGAAPATP